jgi:hypothetical protein
LIAVCGADMDGQAFAEDFSRFTLDQLADQLQAMVHDFNELMAAHDIDPGLQTVQSTKFRLSQVLELIPRIKQRYYVLRAQRAASEDARELLEVIYRGFRDCYVEFVGRLNTFIARNSPPTRQPPAPPLVPIVENRSHSRTHHPKLPTPTFDGNDENWIEFKDKFEALIHNNSELTEIEKFHFLKTAIQLPSGQQNVLQSFGMSTSNYQAAWTAVKTQYDDERKLKAFQFRKLFTVKKMTSESSEELQRVFNTFTTGFTSLQLLGATQDDFQVQLAQNALDDETMKDWNKFLGDRRPTWELMKTFLHRQWKSLDSLSEKKVASKSQLANQQKPKSFSVTSSSEVHQCPKCNDNHRIYDCQLFLDLSVKERFDLVNRKNLCRNCLGSSHYQKDCLSERRCARCKRNHHTLLHFERTNASHATFPPDQSFQNLNLNPSLAPFVPNSTPISNQPSTSSQGSSNFHSTVMTSYEIDTEMLLPTVCFRVLSAAGKWVSCRALMDSGAQSNFISSQFAEVLGIEQEKTFRTVVGVNGQVSAIRRKASVKFSSRYQSYEGTIDCSVSDNITGNLPTRRLDRKKIKVPADLFLADPQFHLPGPIDLLLGTKWYHDALLPNIIRIPGQPLFLETRYGWAVGGEVQNCATATVHSSTPLVSCFCRMSANEDEKLMAKAEHLLKDDENRKFLQIFRRNDPGEFHQV